MTASQKVLVLGGLLLAAFGMLYGLHYALFVEHQTLAGMGASLTQAFVEAAGRHPAESGTALASYTHTKYIYVRQVDVHSHWVGLAMLLVVLGACFNHVSYSERLRCFVAVALTVGAFLFPLGVWLQIAVSGPMPSALAVAGSALVTVAMILTIWGFAPKRVPS